MTPAPKTVRPGTGTRNAMSHLLVFSDDPEQAMEVVGALQAEGYPTTQIALSAEAVLTLARDKPALAILVARGDEFAESGESIVLAKAIEMGTPVLVVVDAQTALVAAGERLAEADDWIFRGALGAELAARVARLLKRGGSTAPEAKPGPSLLIDSQFFALVVHDLRTPLNVIGLSLRMISQAIPKGDADLDEDLRFVEENFKQIERMLTQLSEYYRLFEKEEPIKATEFNPLRLVEDLVEDLATKPAVKRSTVVVDAGPSCPAEVALDPSRARLAIQYALVNANAASNGGPIRLTMRGGPDRWVTEVAIDHPAPSSVHSVVLSPRSFERLCGFAAERRGMDLAIAARVSELFGGSARLDVIENQGSTVLLDWPARLADS